MMACWAGTAERDEQARWTFDTAVYVLGAISPVERHAFEDHLAVCASCQHEVIAFAGLPGLLARLPAAVFGDPFDP